MGILVSVLDRLNKRATLNDLDRWMDHAAMGMPTRAGIDVSPEVAETSSAFHNGVTVITQTVAHVPLKVFRRLDDERTVPATEHPMYWTLHKQPNHFQTSMEWREMMQGHLLLRGNAFAELILDTATGRINLLPRHPDKVSVFLMPDGTLRYLHRPDRGPERVIQQGEMLHLRTRSADGIVGRSVLAYARESLGLTLAQEEYAQRFFSQDARPGGIVKYPNALEGDMRKNLEDSFQKVYGQMSGKHKVMILEDGMEWQSVGVSQEDSQFMQSRAFGVQEMARWLDLPAHFLKDPTKMAFNNVEQLDLDFIRHNMLPWYVRWEQRMDLDLFTPTEQRTLFTQFLLDGLLRGDIKARYEAYAIGRQWGWLSANKILKLENMNPIEGQGGDDHLVPLNMVPMGSMPLSPASSDDDTRMVAIRHHCGLVGDAHAHQTTQDAARCVNRRVFADTKTRSLRSRRSLQESHLGLFGDAAGRIVRREVAELRKATTKHLGQRNLASFNTFLDEFYSRQRDVVRRTLLPVLMAYAEAVQAEAAREIGADGISDATWQPFVNEYADAAAARHVRSSRGQIDKAVSEGEDEDGIAAAVDARVAMWEEGRAEQIAQRETVQAGAAIAKLAWVTLGVTRLVWVANAGACPLCMRLDGRVVAIQDNFVGSGDTVEPAEDGAAVPIRVSGNISHPGLHKGCTCMIGPA